VLQTSTENIAVLKLWVSSAAADASNEKWDVHQNAHLISNVYELMVVRKRPSGIVLRMTWKV